MATCLGERRVEKKVKYGWMIYALSQIKAGDTFRMFEPTGEQVYDDANNCSWVAAKDAYLKHGVYVVDVADTAKEVKSSTEIAKEELAAKLIDTWISAHDGRSCPWNVAVEITATVTKLSDAERDRLLNLEKE